MSEEKVTAQKKQKKPIKKGLKIFLGALIVIAFASTAVFLVKVYFDRENSKPRFEEPAPDPVKSLVALPESAEDAREYVLGLLKDTLAADDAELKWSTGVDLSGEFKTPFNKADEDIILFIKDRAPGQIAAFYPNVGTDPDEAAVICSKATEKPDFGFSPEDVISFTAEQGHTDENGNVRDDAFYFIGFELDTSSLDPEAMEKSAAAEGIKQTLSSAMSVDSLRIEPQSYSVNFKVDRQTNELLDVDISRAYTVKADLTLFNEYSVLTEDGKAQVELPYRANESIRFRHYGARFTSRQMVVKPDDVQSLPADIKVFVPKDDETPIDYELTFDISAPELLEIDSEGVMSVNKTEEERTEYITMHLKYNGHEYSDTLKVFITNKEVPTDE